MPSWKESLLWQSSLMKPCSEEDAKWAGNWQTEQNSTPGFPVREGQALLCDNENKFTSISPIYFLLFKLIFIFSACLPWSQLSNRFTGACKITSGTDLKLPLSACIDFVQSISSEELISCISGLKLTYYSKTWLQSNLTSGPSCRENPACV